MPVGQRAAFAAASFAGGCIVRRRQQAPPPEERWGQRSQQLGQGADALGRMGVRCSPRTRQASAPGGGVAVHAWGTQAGRGRCIQVSNAVRSLRQCQALSTLAGMAAVVIPLVPSSGCRPPAVPLPSRCFRPKACAAGHHPLVDVQPWRAPHGSLRATRCPLHLARMRPCKQPRLSP